MEVQARIGANRRFILKNAVLVYGDGSGSFATLHDVREEKEGAPLSRSRTVADHNLSEVSGARSGSANGAGNPA